MADDVLPWTKEEQDQEDDVGKQTKDDEQDSVPLRSPPEPSQIEPYTPEEKEGGIDEAASVESPVIPSLPVQTALHISADVELTLGNWNAGGTSEQRMKPEILPRVAIILSKIFAHSHHLPGLFFVPRCVGVLRGVRKQQKHRCYVISKQKATLTSA